jgi:Calpain family cysteine protease/Bacterial pre-peptidase C-terminal domain
MPIDNAGNTLGTARGLTLTQNSQTFGDWVGTLDTQDFYRFSLGNRSALNLAVDTLTANADVQLIQDRNNNGVIDSGETITTSARTGTSAESIARNLDAGNYFIRVYNSANSETNYNLRVSATPDFAGDTTAAARNITVGSQTTTYSDSVSSLDTNDYYRFTLNETRNFALTLTNLSADADVKLLRLNSNNTTTSVGSSTNGGSASETINVNNLSAGNYFVQVYRYSGNTAYKLNLSATPQDSTGNTVITARDITPSSFTTTEWVGGADTDDYFRFVLGDSSTLAVTVNNLTANANLQILRLNGDGSTTVVGSSSNTGNTAESVSLTGLTAGRYFARIYQGSGDTSFNLSVTSNYSSTDWSGRNIADTGLLTKVRSLSADGSLNRSDMISIFRDAQDGGTIDVNELIDLRNIVANAAGFAMADNVRVLSNKVVNGDVANAKYQGATLGNLYAGSTGAQMEKLIGKWFLGSDRPVTTNTYSYNSAPLFKDGASITDVKQGGLGDCYYLATLASIAQEKPSYLSNMFIDNGDNTYSVRFFNNGVADYVTVDKYLVTGYANASQELWVGLAEKAYAQLAESGWSRGAGKTNSYASIEGGWMDYVIRQVTGLSATSSNVTSMTKQQLIDLTNSNKILTAGFVNGAGYGVVNSHAYTVQSYNSTTGLFRLNNPWGTTHAEVTWEQLNSLQAHIISSNS